MKLIYRRFLLCCYIELENGKKRVELEYDAVHVRNLTWTCLGVWSLQEVTMSHNSTPG